MQDGTWTFYGREGCDCCATAADFLAHLLRGQRVDVRRVDLKGHPPGAPRFIPAFVDPRGEAVWQGSFDSGATRGALEAWGFPRMQPEQGGITAA